MLLRLQHLYQAGEHPVLSQPVRFPLSAVLPRGLRFQDPHVVPLNGQAQAPPRRFLDEDVELRPLEVLTLEATLARA